MITLLVGLAQSSDPQRANEYDMCLNHNLENRDIDRVTIVEEEPGPRSAKRWLANPKVSLVALNSRASYSDFVAIVNDQCVGGVCVIVNADVYLDWSVKKLEAIPPKTLCAITRTDYFSNLWSSDAWAFMPKMEVKGCGWSLGRSGCETAFCEEVVKQLKWALWNPCYEVRVVHLHGSNVRTAEHGHRVAYTNAPRPQIVAFDRKQKSFLVNKGVSF